MEPDFLAIGTRLNQYMQIKELSQNKLAKLSDTSSSQINNMLRGTKFGVDKLLNILNALPELNSDWLLFGTGPMEKEGAEGKTVNGLVNISGGKKNRQKIYNASELNGQGADTSNVTELQAMLKVCEAEKAGLEKLLESKDRIIELLEKGGK